MQWIEYGKGNPETVMLLHGGGLSWWNYREAAELLAEEYRVILPILDGHGGSSGDFLSLEDTAAKLITRIDREFGGRITALAGLSLGGQIALEMLCQRPGIAEAALIESASVKPDTLTAALIPSVFGMSYGLIRQRWFAKLQAAYTGIPKALFDDYYRDSSAITKENLIRFLQASSRYALKPGAEKIQARVQILVGSREQAGMRESGRLLCRQIPGSTLQLLPGYRHGDLSLNHPEQYVQFLRRMILATIENNIPEEVLE